MHYPKTITLLLLVAGLIILSIAVGKLIPGQKKEKDEETASKYYWFAPDINAVPATEEGQLIHYGRELIANTSFYLGPKGKVTAITNAMNCQNCHLEAGTRWYGNSFSAVASFYPVFRPRSGIVESIEFRVNDCLMRSMNGKSIDSLSKEMRAMVAYLKWLGAGVPKKIKPVGAGTEEIPLLNRAADKRKGEIVYEIKCRSCHGKNGEGSPNFDGSGYLYPPLWGDGSYNTGAGLYRLSRFAGYVKYNMPFVSSSSGPQLTDAEAWDVAAFVNSQPRPEKFFANDWPDITKKSIDYPYGPYADSFSEQQHKYGPFGPIKKAREEKSKK